MTLFIVHHSHDKRKAEQEKWILEIDLWVSHWQASFLDSWNVSVMSLESISLLYIGFLLHESQDHIDAHIYDFVWFALLYYFAIYLDKIIFKNNIPVWLQQ